ncbi:MAG TPA: tetratricopeptide repeat protein [Vicinamibacteria bacterium]|nr:tetratricopeptide repeat protein [Vicinamibacteria bacterium]
MRRDTLVFTAAGVVFGLVVGYMAASWDLVPRPAGGAPAGAAPRGPASPGFNPDEAKALESLAARQPGDAAARVELGNLFMDAGRWREAIRWYREALAVNPGLLDVAADLGACLVSAGEPAEALAEFEKALRADPGHRSALYNKGIALLQMGRGDEAAAAWEELLRRHPDDPQVQGLRGRIEQMRAASARGK